MEAIRFEATLFKSEKVGPGVLLALPKSASLQLPSRGMTLVEGTVNGAFFKAALEPDGNGSHWFRINEDLLKMGVRAGDMVRLEIRPTKDWPEPRVPADLKEALEADPSAQAIWLGITPMARWDWIRWIGAVKQAETRTRRVGKVCSMLKAGKRRPCCFDRTQCTLTEA